MVITIETLKAANACCPAAIEEFAIEYPEGFSLDNWTRERQIALLLASSFARRYFGWAVAHGVVPIWSMDGAYLRNADLANANLYRANLAHADLAGANLRGAYLCGANLANADLRGADLAGAVGLPAAAPETAAECDRLKAINAELLAALEMAETIVTVPASYKAAWKAGHVGEFLGRCSNIRAAIAKAEGRKP